MSLRVKRWRVVYGRPGDFFERKSRPVSKREALNLMSIFDDALYVEKFSGFFQRRIMKKGKR